MGARKIKPKQQAEHSILELMSSRYIKYGALSVVLLACSMLVNQLYQPSTLPFKTIQIYGQLSWIDRDELNAMVLNDIDGGFFSLDVKGLKQTLEQQEWIKSVAIRRAWPETLQITVNEQQPVAVWNGEYIVNREGELFHPVDQHLPEFLVKVSGPAGTHHLLMSHYLALAELTKEVGLRIASISINERRALQVILTNGIRVLMGRVRSDRESTIEMERFIHAYKARLAPKLDQIKLVDLRYTNGLAIRWKKEFTQKQTQSVVSRGITQG